MPQEPKKRHSRQRQGKRRAAIHLTQGATVACSNCGVLNPAHTICKSCGYYKGKEIINKKKTKIVKKQEEPTDVEIQTGNK